MSNSRWKIWLLYCAIWLTCPWPDHDACGDFPELLQRIPDQANAIILVNVDRVFQSEIAQRDNWRQKYSDEFAANPLLLPPNATQFVMAAELEFPQMVPNWEMAIMNLSLGVDPQKIAVEREGVLDQLNGTQIVWTPDAAVIMNSPKQITVMSPLSRQSASRLISDWQDQRRPALSSYLQEASAYATAAKTEIILAIDVGSVFSVQHMQQLVEASRILQGMDVKTSASLLASIRGVTFGCRVTDKLRGAVRFDFGENMEVFKEVARPLMLEVLEEAGASLNEFDQWECIVAGTRMQLTGDLTPQSMRRMFSLFSLDSVVQDGGAAATTDGEEGHAGSADVASGSDAPPADSPEARRAAAREVARRRQEQRRRDVSLKYFHAVNQYIDEVVNNHPEDIADIAFWVQNYARRISRLSRSNVDPELAAYGKFIAGSFQQIVGILEGVQEQINYRASQIDPTSEVEVIQMPIRRFTTGVPFGFGNGVWGQGAMFGTYRVFEHAPMYRQRLDFAAARKEYNKIVEQEQAKGKKEIQKILASFDEEEQYMRDRMTEKYGVSF